LPPRLNTACAAGSPTRTDTSSWTTGSTMAHDQRDGGRPPGKGAGQSGCDPGVEAGIAYELKGPPAQIRAPGRPRESYAAMPSEVFVRQRSPAPLLALPDPPRSLSPLTSWRGADASMRRRRAGQPPPCPKARPARCHHPPARPDRRRAKISRYTPDALTHFDAARGVIAGGRTALGERGQATKLRRTARGLEQLLGEREEQHPHRSGPHHGFTGRLAPGRRAPPTPGALLLPPGGGRLRQCPRDARCGRRGGVRRRGIGSCSAPASVAEQRSCPALLFLVQLRSGNGSGRVLVSGAGVAALRRDGGLPGVVDGSTPGAGGGLPLAPGCAGVKGS
jgi:hypothetical protein